jgi:predicted methyltransferase
MHLKRQPFYMPLRPILTFAHELVASVLPAGATAIDGTVGNGHDTLLLARLVGAYGMVYGFDVQEAALDAARHRLEAAGVLGQVTLLNVGHENIPDVIPARPTVTAAMFNLGYLPGSDRSLITRPETTIPALEAVLARLVPAGLLTVVLYPGHEGGAHEARAVLEWARQVDPGVAKALSYQFLNPRTPPPSLLAIEKR